MQIVDLENTFVEGLTHDDEERHALGIKCVVVYLVCCISFPCVCQLLSALVFQQAPAFQSFSLK